MHIETERLIITEFDISMAENISSQKVLEKCGFKRIFHGKGEYQGKFCEIIKYVLTVE